MKSESNIKEFKISKRSSDKLKLVIPLVIGASLSGCTVYSDGRVAGAFDQGSIKAELMRAEREYGGR
jgi:hypothetical protein